MTVNEIKVLDREFLIPADVAPILGCDAQDIRVAARQRPDLLGFPVSVIGTRTKIPRLGFLNWLEGRCVNGNAS
jgi:hypothetical protein